LCPSAPSRDTGCYRLVRWSACGNRRYWQLLGCGQRDADPHRFWGCWELALCQIGDGLWELEIGIQVRIVVTAAVASPPTGVERKLHEICEPRLAARSSGGAARYTQN